MLATGQCRLQSQLKSRLSSFIMKILSKYCPTYVRLCSWLWHSPTFTTWGNYVVQSMRLVLITPFILTRFDETEIASWYLFASLNFFGMIMSQRMGLTFSRMFAFAMGGASNLAPIKGKREMENEGKPNWNAFERAYGTIGSLNLVIAWLNVLVAFGMGWFGLGNLLQGYEAKGVIWLAFALMQGTALLTFVFQHYQLALQGMNYVALVNRWGVIFGIASCLAGSLSLYLGGGLITLVVVMQLFSIAGIFRNWFLLKAVEGGRVALFRGFGFDREVFGWAWEPTWKGLVAQFGQSGSVQLTAILYTSYATKGEVASYLFALRMMQMMTQISHAPFGAIQPLMSRLISMGDMLQLRRIIMRRGLLTLILYIVGVAVAGLCLPPLLEVIGSQVQFPPVYQWLTFGSLMFVIRFDVLCASVSTLGNEMVFYWETAIAALVSVCLAFWVKDEWGLYGPILASLLPTVLILNIGPYRKAVSILGEKESIG